MSVDPGQRAAKGRASAGNTGAGLQVRDGRALSDTIWLRGVLTEVLEDVSFQFTPVHIATAREIIDELRGVKPFA